MHTTDVREHSASAQDHLQYLQQELATTRDDITDATEELHKMSAMLPEDDKQALRDRLTNKMATVGRRIVNVGVFRVCPQ